MKRSLAALGVLALVGTVGGCNGFRAKRAIDKQRDKGSAQLAALKKVADKIDTQPPVETTEWKLPAGVKLDFEPMLRGSFEHPKQETNPAYNTALTHASYLRTPCQAESVRWYPTPSGDSLILLTEHSDEWLIEPACYVENSAGKYAQDLPAVDLVTSRLDHFVRTKYVLAIRLRKIDSPSINLAEGTTTTKSFNPGVLEGDAVLFDIASGDYLGGFPIHVDSGETVKLKKYDGAKELQLKLSERLDSSIKSKLGEIGATP